jgi:hypothetical protein
LKRLLIALFALITLPLGMAAGAPLLQGGSIFIYMPDMAKAPPTETPAPTPTDTPIPTATATLEPTATVVVVSPVPTATNTPPPAGPTATPTRDPALCAAEYPTVCIPPPPPDLDCSQISFRNFPVLQPDRHRFDSDKNGIGCETN